jgi:phosphoglycerate dehydrogenase-like enzyme
VTHRPFPDRSPTMDIRRSYLILGRVPNSPLFEQINSRHTITHIATKALSRQEFKAKVAALPNKSYTFLLILGESQHLYPMNEELIGPLQIECLCKVGAGYDSLDVEYFTRRGTWVAIAPNAVRVPTAEGATALILATAKGLGLADKHVRRGEWKRRLGLQNNISGMTLGIVGLGAIGKVRAMGKLLREGSREKNLSLGSKYHLL